MALKYLSDRRYTAKLNINIFPLEWQRLIMINYLYPYRSVLVVSLYMNNTHTHTHTHTPHATNTSKQMRVRPAVFACSKWNKIYVS